MSWGRWDPYVPVGRRQANARRQAASLAKKSGRELQPVQVQSRKIARTFWGKAWCENLEQYSDFSNRLPRGRTYARNGSIIDLMISSGRIDAIVAGRDTYTVEIEIDALKPAVWKRIKSDCAESIDSLLDLLAGRFSDGVMQRLTREKDGLFPRPKEIHMSCSCPDWATVCKHVAATFYGVAVQLDDHPELLFQLREVDHNDLVGEAVAEGNLETAFGLPSDDLGGADLGELFGIELESATPRAVKKKARKTASSPTGKKAVKKTVKKKAAATRASVPAKTRAAQQTATVRKKTVKKKSVKKKAAKVTGTPAIQKKAVKTKVAKKTAATRKTAR